MESDLHKPAAVADGRWLLLSEDKKVIRNAAANLDLTTSQTLPVAESQLEKYILNAIDSWVYSVAIIEIRALDHG